MNIFLDHVNNTSGLSGALDYLGYGLMKPLQWVIAPIAAERIRCHRVEEKQGNDKQYEVIDTQNPIRPQSTSYLITVWRVASLALGLLLVAFTTPLALFCKGFARLSSQETRLKYQAEFPAKKDVKGVPENAEDVRLSFIDACSICQVLYPIYSSMSYQTNKREIESNFNRCYGKTIDSSLPIQKTSVHVVIDDAFVDYLVLQGTIAGYKHESSWEYWLIFNQQDLDQVVEGKLAFVPGKDDIVTKASLLARYRQKVETDYPAKEEVVPSVFDKVGGYLKPVKLAE